MNQGIVIQIILIAAGIIMMLLAIGSLAKRKMAEQVCMVWGFIAIIFIISGIILRPDGWVNMISTAGLILLVIVCASVFFGLYLMSTRLSDVIRKNNELAMQVSLLNEEMWNLKQTLKQQEENETQKAKVSE